MSTFNFIALCVAFMLVQTCSDYVLSTETFVCTCARARVCVCERVFMCNCIFMCTCKVNYFKSEISWGENVEYFLYIWIDLGFKMLQKVSWQFVCVVIYVLLYLVTAYHIVVIRLVKTLVKHVDGNCRKENN